MFLQGSMASSDFEFVQMINKYGIEDTQRRCEGKIKALGSGTNAVAYLLPSGNVARVEHGVNEDGYAMWMEKVVMKDKSTMSPKIFHYQVEKDIRSKDYLSISIQERLHSINSDRKAFRTMSSVSYDIAGILQHKNPEKRWNEVNGSRDFFKKFAPLVECIKLAEVVKDSGLSLNDTHMGNIMYRKMGDTIVVTDPVN